MLSYFRPFIEGQDKTMPHKHSATWRTIKKSIKIPKLLPKFIVVIFLTTVIIPLLFGLYYQGKIYPNIYVANQNLSGKSQSQAYQQLESYYQDIKNLPLKLAFQDKNWQLTAGDLGLEIDLAQTVNKAYQIGRNPSIFTNIQTLFKLQSKEESLAPILIVNQDKLNEFLTSIENEINIPLTQPSLFISTDGTLVLTSAQPGREVEKQLLTQLITNTFITKLEQPILIPVSILLPQTTSSQEEDTRARAERLVSKKLVLEISDKKYPLEKNELINLISFTGGFAEEKIASFTANLSHSYDTPPQDAAFKFENGKVTVFKPAKDGIALNQSRTIPLVLGELENLESTTSSQLVLTIPITNSPPNIKTGDANDLGIRELLGRGISYFRGSIAGRVHNIALAAARINGAVVKPGEEFSFNASVGDISSATGYQQAYIIQNGRTILGDGGGVCQVSTTLFRAVLNSGLPITARTAHAYRVAYYEQGFGAGLDATVYSPSVDFKFTNDTPAHILIQAYPDTQNYTLIFEIYGTSDGRTAYVSTPRIWDQSPPPPPKYEDDPTLPAGTEKQVDFAAWGAKAAFDYKVTRGDETLIEKTFYSSFRPWQAVFLKGTKTN